MSPNGVTSATELNYMEVGVNTQQHRRVAESEEQQSFKSAGKCLRRLITRCWLSRKRCARSTSRANTHASR
ncbi:hypothetical protein EYF80_025604 [Liparis tanakae]|uniref:Uncharacterized protein n=1 Tax=Liparis tanakae TaxID=230148 RepID=A0A4Z2HEG4_9TELE|nr:hypothetical protein EYF80_025604 [Liparis tanakae]